MSQNSSLSETAFNALNEVVYTYIQHIANKHGLDEADLVNDWSGVSTKKPIVKKSVVKKPTTKVVKKVATKVESLESVDESKSDNEENGEILELDPETLLSYKKPELQALCRDRGLKCSGTKDQLISFLLNVDVSEVPKKAAKNPTSKMLQTVLIQKL